MTSDPGDPARVSTNTHEVLRFLSSIYVTDATVTTVGPGRHLAYEGAGDGTIVCGYRCVEEAPGGAEFVEGLEVKLSGPIRLLEPLFTRPVRTQDLRGAPRPETAPGTRPLELEQREDPRVPSRKDRPRPVLVALTYQHSLECLHKRRTL